MIKCSSVLTTHHVHVLNTYTLLLQGLIMVDFCCTLIEEVTHTRMDAGLSPTIINQCKEANVHFSITYIYKEWAIPKILRYLKLLNTIDLKRTQWHQLEPGILVRSGIQMTCSYSKVIIGNFLCFCNTAPSHWYSNNDLPPTPHQCKCGVNARLWRKMLII